MGVYVKAAGAVLVAVVLIVMLDRRDMGLLLAMAVCAMLAAAALEYLEPVTDLIHNLSELGELDGTMISVLLKAVGISLLTEIAGMVCIDSGNGSMAKALRLLGTAVVLWLSMPLFNALLELIQEILGGL